MNDTPDRDTGAKGDLRDHVVFRMSLYATIADRNGKVFFNDRFGLSLREYRILGVLAYAQPISLMGLAEECYLDKGQVSRVVSKLEDDLLIERFQDDDTSARGGKLRLTAKGAALIEEALAFADTLNDRALAMLSDAERQAFSETLDRLLAHARSLYAEVQG